MSITRRRFIQSSAALATTMTNAHGRSSNKPEEASGWRSRQLDRKQNVVVVVLDDVGFGDLRCYGSEIPTRCIDTLASRGVRYNNFHVTSLCAPTRASLLTGLNSHSAGVGNIAEWGRDHPGYRGWIRDDVQTLAEMLSNEGYRNYAVGKWHLSRVDDQNASGPYDQWPIGRGFDHWYGFHGAASDHWHPELFLNSAAVYPEKSTGYHLTEDLVERSTEYIKDHNVSAPDVPFFLYLAFGACHFPYHVPDQYMQAHRGRYDAGWDDVRQQRFSRQLSMGMVPHGTRLSPRNSDVPAWNSISVDEQRFSARTQEAYAGFLHHTDDQLQRLVDFLEFSGQLDNTILIVLSDNGAGSWAPPAGRLDVHRVVYIEPETIDELISNIDKVGTAQSQPSYSPGWAQVSNTPLKLYKGNTYEGGIKTPMIIHWPNGDLPNGGIGSQYHHVSDVVPTLLELGNLDSQSVDGMSFAYTLDAPTADSRKKQQYYETAGDRAMWVDGWKAVTKHQTGSDFASDHWALYDTRNDFSETHDLSGKHPDRLANMVNAWDIAAKNNNVLPMSDDVLSIEKNHRSKPRSHFVFYPNTTRISARSAPDIYHFDYEMAVELELIDARASGVLLASGDSMAGYELLMNDGYFQFIYIYTRSERYSFKATNQIAKGSHTLTLRGRKTGEQSGRIEFLVDGKPGGSLTIPKMWETKSLNAGVRCGANHGAPVSETYRGAFEFNQQLKRLVVALDV